MNIQDKVNNITNLYPYFDEFHVSDSDSHSKLHPAIKVGLATTIESFSGSDFNRLVLLLPRRHDYALWISFLTTLWVMKNDFELEYKKVKLIAGNKIKLNNCIVEYIKEELSPDGKTWLMWVRCSDGNYAFRLDREYTVVPISTGKSLNKMERVHEAYRQSKLTGYPLDDLLDIKANGNLNIFRNCVVTVSRRSKFEQFIDNYSLNGANLKKLIMTGKLRDDGSPVGISTDAAENTIPTCIVSSDMFRLASYVENSVRKDRSLTGVIIDGASYCRDNIQIIDDYLFPNNIPVTVVADYSDRQSLKLLQERGFSVLHFNNKLLPHIFVEPDVKHGPFRYIERSLSNYKNQTIVVEKIKDHEISNLYQKIFSIEKIVDPQNIDQIIRECWVTLLSITLDISRRWHMPSKVYLNKMLEKLEHAESQFNSRMIWITDEIKHEYSNIFFSIRQLLNNFEETISNKLTNIELVIDQLSNINTKFLTADEAEARSAAKYWRNKFYPDYGCSDNGLIDSDIEFMPFSKLEDKSINLSILEMIGISGWPGKEKFLNILSLFLSPKICLFLYEPEIRWFEAVRAEWTRLSSIHSDKIILNKMFGVSTIDINELYKDKLKPENNLDQQEEVEDVFFKLKNYQLSKYISSSKDTDTLRTKYIKFSDGRFAFMTESHMHHIVSDLMRKKQSSEIPKRKTDELKMGDYILFLDSDRNIIRDIADKWLERENKSLMREEAALWRLSLMKKYDRLGRDINKLSEVLNASGCSRTPTTLRKWLFDDDIIGPQDYEHDLRCIAEATGDSTLKEKLLDVKIAIGNLRSIHMQAASIVRERCIAKLSNVLDKNYISQQDAMILDVEDIKATILRVEEIGSEWLRVKHTEINRLHVMENL